MGNPRTQRPIYLKPHLGSEIGGKETRSAPENGGISQQVDGIDQTGRQQLMHQSGTSVYNDVSAALGLDVLDLGDNVAGQD
jgi:hypothetical protein